MNIRKYLRRIFFAYEKKTGDIYLISKPLPNYFILCFAVIGFLACFLNILWLGFLALGIVFVSMTTRTVLYFNIYKLYHANNYQFEDVGSKYSFSHPKTLIIRKK